MVKLKLSASGNFSFAENEGVVLDRIFRLGYNAVFNSDRQKSVCRLLCGGNKKLIAGKLGADGIENGDDQ